MVKGVNKNIIEVNNTGSDIFEKIVFYVTPEYGTLGAKALNEASMELEKIFSPDSQDNFSLRKIVKNKARRKKLVIFSVAFVVFISIIVSLAIIFK